ncbi:unnamed protein product [Urochloa humidicola]
MDMNKAHHKNRLNELSDSDGGAGADGDGDADGRWRVGCCLRVPAPMESRVLLEGAGTDGDDVDGDYDREGSGRRNLGGDREGSGRNRKGDVLGMESVRIGVGCSVECGLSR